jgi:hypothetical protein
MLVAHTCTQEAEIRRIMVWSQAWVNSSETLSLKNPSHKKKSGGVAQGVGPEFKPQSTKKEEKDCNNFSGYSFGYVPPPLACKFVNLFFITMVSIWFHCHPNNNLAGFLFSPENTNTLGSGYN